MYYYLQLRCIRAVAYVDGDSAEPRMMVATADSSIVSLFWGQKYQRSCRLAGRDDSHGYDDSGVMWDEMGRFRIVLSFLRVGRPPAALGPRRPRFPERAADVDHLTYVLVSDTSSHTVRKLHLSSGSLSTLLGVDSQSGVVSGSRDVSRLDSPQGLRCSL